MRFTLLFVATLASFANAFPASSSKRDSSPLAVTLEVQNTLVKANVVNKGPNAIKLLHLGNLLDNDEHLQKVQVSQAGKELSFKGMHVVLSPDLSESAFQILPAGGSIQASFDIASTYDLSQGGAFDVVAKGALSYAELNTTAIIGAFPFTSNTVTTTVNGTQAAQAHDHHALARRTFLEEQPRCSTTQYKKAGEALKLCQGLSSYASQQARFSNRKFMDYWKPAEKVAEDIAKRVRFIYDGISKECGKENKADSKTFVFCVDSFDFCKEGDYIMRPMTEAGSIFLCPRFFDDARTRQKDAPCHVLDRGTLMIESMSMLDILSGRKYPTNRDGTPSGYREIMQWDGRKSFESAPTYAYFAQAVAYERVHQARCA